MSKKLTGRALARFEAGRDVWQEVLDGARAIKAGKGKRVKVQPRSPIVRARLKSGLTQGKFADLLGVWSNGSRAAVSPAAPQRRLSAWRNGIPRFCATSRHDGSRLLASCGFV